MIVASRLFLIVVASLGVVDSFGPPLSMHPSSSSLRMSSSDTTATTTTLLQVTLEKPLGMILEEVEEGQPHGVYVKVLADEGSAISSQYKDQLVGLKLATVMEQDVTGLTFDNVMEQLIAAPSPVALEFIMESSDDDVEFRQEFEVGTTVTIKVLEDNDKKETVIEAKVGDNLRKTLLENNVQVYKGLKHTLGNCGGAGQCTFCAAEFIENEGWLERSDYEDQKLKKSPNARLTCLNNIQGPATIRL
jgi:2Fe-2S ferredoxin